MALTDKEIAKFATFAVERPVYLLSNPTPERKAKIMRESRLSALAYYGTAIDDIRRNGYRITSRVRAVVLKSLTKIEWREFAPRTIGRQHLTVAAMVNGNERRHPEVVIDGRKNIWVEFGWVDQGAATRADLSQYALCTDD